MNAASRRSAQALILSIALMVFWIACVASLHTDELLVGIPSVLLSVAFSFYSIRKLPIRFRPTLASLLTIWRLPWNIAADLVQVLWVLAKDLSGRPASAIFRSAPWYPVSPSPQDIARRTLAVAYTTVSPNCIVLGIDRRRGQILFHQLKADELPTLTRQLGAGDAP